MSAEKSHSSSGRATDDSDSIFDAVPTFGSLPEDFDCSDLPKTIIMTGLPKALFEPLSSDEGDTRPPPVVADLANERSQEQETIDETEGEQQVDGQQAMNEPLRLRFERLLKSIDPTAHIIYLRSFRRAIVTFASSEVATKIRIHVHGTRFGGNEIRCFYYEPHEYQQRENRRDQLRPPTPEKQFLISPPASPPVGWEPRKEDAPITLEDAARKAATAINFELISALARLQPDNQTEILTATESNPAIVIHACGTTNEDGQAVVDEDTGADPVLTPKAMMLQRTRSFVRQPNGTDNETNNK